MSFRVGTRPSTFFVDLVDNFAPDRLRGGDNYDILSGRAGMHFAMSMNPFLTPANEMSVRRARVQDLTSSGLGFELLISHEGELHNAIVHLPPADHDVWQSGELPVVIDAHGYSDAPRRHAERSGIPEDVVQAGGIAVSIGGSRGMSKMPLWDPLRSHDGMNVPMPLTRQKQGARMIDELLESLTETVQAHADQAGIETEVSINREGSIAVGLSNGGAFATLLAASGVVNGAISFSGPTSPDIKGLEADGNVSMVFVEGHKDSVIPIDGSGSPDYLVAEDAVKPFLQRNGQKGMTAEQLPDFLQKHVQPGVKIVASSKEGPTVAVLRIDEHGHAVPGSKPAIPNQPGLSDKLGLGASNAISGSKLVADFLTYQQS